jgi:transcriptional regulator with XRE-family HTH domain
MPVMTKSPSGEDIVILSRREYDALIADRNEDASDAVRANQILARLESGTETTLSAADVSKLLAAKTPLAFWRRHRGLTQQDLSRQTDIAQGFLSEIENGSKTGDLQTVSRIAEALSLTIDDLVVQSEPPARKKSRPRSSVKIRRDSRTRARNDGRGPKQGSAAAKAR